MPPKHYYGLFLFQLQTACTQSSFARKQPQRPSPPHPPPSTTTSAATALASNPLSSTERRAQLRRAGGLMGLVALLRIFGVTLEVTDSTDASATLLFERRLPTLWNLLWKEPLSILRGGSQPQTAATTDSFEEDVQFLRSGKYRWNVLCFNAGPSPFLVEVGGIAVTASSATQGSRPG